MLLLYQKIELRQDLSLELLEREGEPERIIFMKILKPETPADTGVHENSGKVIVVTP